MDTVAEVVPLKQGLKLEAKVLVVVYYIVVEVKDPLKQGLKLNPLHSFLTFCRS